MAFLFFVMIQAVYGAVGFAVIYFAVRLAIRHERGTGETV